MCAPFWMNQVPYVGVTKIQKLLASWLFWGPLLLVDKNNNTAKYLKHSLKILCLISTMGTRRHKPLCLEEPVWLWIYLLLSLNQTKTDCFTYRNPLLKEREPENSKLQSYWNHSLMFLWFLWQWKRSVLPLQFWYITISNWK